VPIIAKIQADKKVDYIIHAFGIVLLKVNPIADHIDEIKGRDGTISFNKSWTNEVHLVHFVDLCGIQNRVSLFGFYSFIALPLIHFQTMLLHNPLYR
jgi:hypothetical protein